MQNGFCISKLVLGFIVTAAISVSAGAMGPNSVFDRNGKRLPDREANSEKVAWELLSIQQHAEFGAMGLLSAGFFGGGCSATIVDAGGNDQTPVYIVTNGHCLMNGMPRPGQFIVDQPPASGMNFTARYFRDAGRSKVTFQVQRVEYATMTGTDMAVMRLAATRRDLAQKNLQGFRLARHAPPFGEDVANVGIPQSGVSPTFLRRSLCKILEQVDLREGGWSFSQAYRNQCSVVGGSSGSSLISTTTREIVALINTGVDDSVRTPCEENHPCETTGGSGGVSHPEFNYAQRVHELSSCFDAQGVLRIRDPQCQLQR